MTPSARLQAAIEILDRLQTTALPADRFIRDWFRTRRYAGSKDRAAVAERVFAVLRRRASFSWRMQSEEPRGLILANLLADGAQLPDIEALFNGAGYGPKPLREDERAAILSAPRGDPPLWVQGEFPAFLEEELRRSLGAALLDEMHAMQARAPVDLRVNTLKASRHDVLALLRGEGFDAAPTPYAPHGIRILAREGLAQLSRHVAFENGSFEFQDEAAQIAALLCDAKPGERILDLAAGAGGKALAFAAAMNDQGEIVASDIHAGRLQQIAVRGNRAGVTIIRTQTDVPDGGFDAVFIDAPCSGSGTWRRQPEQKWRLIQARLAELTALQGRLLELGAMRVRPGGRLVYATCSLLACENDDRIAAFLAKRPDFVLRPAVDVWREVTNAPPPPGLGEFFRATPATTGTDGFFAAIFVRED
ncbi:MAG: RsmB/NOP family class I SAM-dependent RNA methyltransferase [Rhizomicrobium sp.]